MHLYPTLVTDSQWMHLLSFCSSSMNFVTDEIFLLMNITPFVLFRIFQLSCLSFLSCNFHIEPVKMPCGKLNNCNDCHFPTADSSFVVGTVSMVPDITTETFIHHIYLSPTCHFNFLVHMPHTEQSHSVQLLVRKTKV